MKKSVNPIWICVLSIPIAFVIAESISFATNHLTRFQIFLPHPDLFLPCIIVMNCIAICLEIRRQKNAGE